MVNERERKEAILANCARADKRVRSAQVEIGMDVGSSLKVVRYQQFAIEARGTYQGLEIRTEDEDDMWRNRGYRPLVDAPCPSRNEELAGLPDR